MRRLGADLHDGPAQLISLALLRLGTAKTDTASAENTISVRQVLSDALRDIRNLSVGFAVPEIDTLCLAETVRTVVDRHARLTGTTVECTIDKLLPTVSHATRLCAYRFVQEALSNAYRHAGGAGQMVSADVDEECIVITVTDHGDFTEGVSPTTGSGLGLRGLADRIESLGGTLDVHLRGSDGSRLTARLPITTSER